LGTAVPQQIIDDRAVIIAAVSTKEAEINALTTKA